MDKLDKVAEIRGQLNQLQEYHRKAMAACDDAQVNALQMKISRLSERQREILSRLTAS